MPYIQQKNPSWQQVYCCKYAMQYRYTSTNTERLIVFAQVRIYGE